MEAAVIIIAIFAVVIIVVALAFRHRLKAMIKGPGGTRMKIDASNPLPRPGVQAKNITSRRGTVTATDETGRGTDVNTVDAYKDVNISTRLTQENLPPKSPSPGVVQGENNTIHAQDLLAHRDIHLAINQGIPLEQFQRLVDILEDVSTRILFDSADTQSLTNLSFWLKDVLDPTHAAMSDVHEIYVKTFKEAEELLNEYGSSSLKMALHFLSKRHSETSLTRENLQGMRRSIGRLDGIPDEITSYLNSCENYFSRATGIAVSTPMRTLLERLSRLNDMSALSNAQIEAMNPEYGRDLVDSASQSVRGVIYQIEKDWPDVATQYYSARLRFLQRSSKVKNQVLALVQKKFILNKALSTSIKTDPESANRFTEEIIKIDRKIQELMCQ